ncbi:MAG: hypothetical protein AAGK03_10510, partial [Pseudomonadota bacterium]
RHALIAVQDLGFATGMKGRFDDLSGSAAKSLPQVPTDAASARAENPKSGLSRFAVIDAACGEGLLRSPI